MFVVTLICKFKGCRAGDLLRLTWGQICIKHQEIIFKPRLFKNKRTTGRWLFCIKNVPGRDSLIEALNMLKGQSEKIKEDDRMFRTWATNNVSYYFDKHKEYIGEKLSAHKIRVLTRLALTSLGWRDSSIKSFLHWKADESLETYHAGFSTAKLLEEKDLLMAYGQGFEGDKYQIVCKIGSVNLVNNGLVQNILL